MLLKICSSVSLVLLIVAVSLANTPAKWYEPSNPWIDWIGGPDAYGYTARDSDEPGGPSVEWIDITGIGTEITGLGDDNYAGPFNIGFNFNFYWYTVNQVYVGSNGYIKFPPAYNIASPFPASIPLPAAPNDYLGIYTADLTFDTGGDAYYWSNGVNQFVVSFINVPAWSTGGSHTFQVVFDGTNNTIHMNYGNQQGTFYNNDDIIGIECVTGQVGLERLHDTYIPHNNYTIYFYRPDSTGYVVHDFALTNVINEGSLGTFFEVGDIYNPVVWVKNTGNQPEIGANANCRITNSAGATVYNQTQSTGALSPGAEIMITYIQTWTASTSGYYTITATVSLVGDMNPNNNTKAGELEVVTIPGELKFDDGIANTSTSWIGGTGGIGMKFVPPEYPVTITQAKFYIYSVSTLQTFYARIYDDNGPGGTPGTMLFGTTVNSPTAMQWYTVNTYIPVESGAFYVSWEMTGDNSTTIGIDQTAPISRNTWENTGVWAPYRSGETDEGMIRAYVTPMVIPNMTITLTPVNPPIQIPQTGGSFQYIIVIHNGGTVSQQYDGWTNCLLPDSTVYGPILLRMGLNLAAGGTLTRTMTQMVPAGLTPGEYSYRGFVGVYPGTVWDQDAFPFTVLADEGASKGGSWKVFGWDEPGLNEPLAPVGKFSLSASPNPFNAITTIPFSLPVEAKVKVEVYNVMGQKVAVLNDDVFSAGEYEATWDASNASSGMYLVVMEAQGIADNVKYHSVEKLLLLK